MILLKGQHQHLLAAEIPLTHRTQKSVDFIGGAANTSRFYRLGLCIAVSLVDCHYNGLSESLSIFIIQAIESPFFLGSVILSWLIWNAHSSPSNEWLWVRADTVCELGWLCRRVLLQLDTTRVTLKEGASTDKMSLPDFLDWWLMWEGPGHCGQYYSYGGDPGHLKRAEWASQQAALLQSFCWSPVVDEPQTISWNEPFLLYLSSAHGVLSQQQKLKALASGR